MEIPAKYDAAVSEEKWYQYWLDNKFFSSKPDGRKSFTIVIPPPNVTGVLHMGHMLNNTIQDILTRRARMKGFNALWVPGTDHASIATEAKVVQKLAKQGIKKRDLTREEFLKYAWEWKEEHGGVILEQLKKLGASCDWSRTAFTMDELRSESVLKVFVDLYKKGLIYRGLRMVTGIRKLRPYFQPKRLFTAKKKVNFSILNIISQKVKQLHLPATKAKFFTKTTKVITPLLRQHVLKQLWAILRCVSIRKIRKINGLEVIKLLCLW